MVLRMTTHIGNGETQSTYSSRASVQEQEKNDFQYFGLLALPAPDSLGERREEGI